MKVTGDPNWPYWQGRAGFQLATNKSDFDGIENVGYRIVGNYRILWGDWVGHGAGVDVFL